MATPEWDVLNLSLHDAELTEELELLIALIVIANNAEAGVLNQTDIDSCLGLMPDRVSARRACAGD